MASEEKEMKVGPQKVFPLTQKRTRQDFIFSLSLSHSFSPWELGITSFSVTWYGERNGKSKGTLRNVNLHQKGMTSGHGEVGGNFPLIIVRKVLGSGGK